MVNLGRKELDGVLREPLDSAKLLEFLDSVNAPHPQYDNLKSTGELVSKSSEWQFARQTCDYVATAIEGWKTDVPKKASRHHWLQMNLTRVAAFHRAGCISEQDYMLAIGNLGERFDWLVAHLEPTREVRHNEVRECMLWGISKVEGKSEEELALDLRHDHEEPKEADTAVVTSLMSRLSGEKSNGNGHKKTRSLILRPASSYKVKAVRWAWQDRIAEGTFALLAGPEGIGKSTIAFWMAAQVTKGTLPGKLEGKPKNVIIVAKEDSWAMTIVPRLAASGADLDKVFNIAINENEDAILSLPHDNAELMQAIVDYDVALVILDPLVSQLDGKLDTHKDGEIRQGLEPLKVIAETTGCFMVGLIHFNKGQAKNVLDRIMGSKAFTAVARSVHAVLPDDEQQKGHGYLMTVKNNLGRSGLPLLQYHIESAKIRIEDRQDDDDEYTNVGAVVWDEESHESAEEVYDRIYNPKSVIAQALSGGNKDERADELAAHIRKMVEDNGGEMEVDKIELSLIQENLIEANAAGRKRAARARKKAGLLSKKGTGERYTGWIWYVDKLGESI